MWHPVAVGDLPAESKTRWYQGKVIVGVVCGVLGLGIGSAESDNPKESDAYVSLAQNYEHAKSDVAAANDRTDELAGLEADLTARKADLDERATTLKSAELTVEKREQAVKALREQLEAKAARSAPTAAAPVPLTSRTGSCTRTSTEKCIQGGQFCPKSKFGQIGHDANRVAYRCGGSTSHPHWQRS